MLKFISWNVNGLRACYDKGFVDVFHRLEADFFCLQETKMQEGQLDAKFEGYHSYWNYAEKKGYSGTAIFSKVKPLSVTYGLGIEEHDHEGRVITLELASFYLITVYTPNSQEELRRLDYRMKWEDDFRAYLKKLEEKKPVIVCGDLNRMPDAATAGIRTFRTAFPTERGHHGGTGLVVHFPGWRKVSYLDRLSEDILLGGVGRTLHLVYRFRPQSVIYRYGKHHCRQ